MKALYALVLLVVVGVAVYFGSHALLDAVESTGTDGADEPSKAKKQAKKKQDETTKARTKDEQSDGGTSGGGAGRNRSPSGGQSDSGSSGGVTWEDVLIGGLGGPAGTIAEAVNYFNGGKS